MAVPNNPSWLFVFGFIFIYLLGLILIFDIFYIQNRRRKLSAETRRILECAEMPHELPSELELAQIHP